MTSKIILFQLLHSANQMKTNNLNIESIEEFDDYIQSLDTNQLKQIEKDSIFLFSNQQLDDNLVDEQDYLEIDNYIQSLQISELREIEKNSEILNKIFKSTIKHKSKITGLDERIILLIETKKEKATIEQLMIYCNKLHIPYQKIVPEFFNH